MNKKVLIGIIAAAAIILLAAWAYMLAQPPATDTVTDTPAPAPVPAPTEPTVPPAGDTNPPQSVATITYTDEGFTPNNITVKKGSTITVTNRSSKDVMLSSADHPTHQKQPELNMKTLGPNESGTITVTEVGTWGYHDHVDASMTGTITVTE